MEIEHAIVGGARGVHGADALLHVQKQVPESVRFVHAFLDRLVAFSREGEYAWHAKRVKTKREEYGESGGREREWGGERGFERELTGMKRDSTWFKTRAKLVRKIQKDCEGAESCFRTAFHAQSSTLLNSFKTS